MSLASIPPRVHECYALSPQTIVSSLQAEAFASPDTQIDPWKEAQDLMLGLPPLSANQKNPSHVLNRVATYHFNFGRCSIR